MRVRVCVSDPSSEAELLLGICCLIFQGCFLSFFFFFAKEKCITFDLCILWNSVNNGQLGWGVRTAKETDRKEIPGGGNVYLRIKRHF